MEKKEIHDVILMDNGWLILKVNDEIITDANFTEGIAVSELAKSEIVQYNLSLNCFEYGLNAMDRGNAGDEWLEIEEMDKNENEKLLLYFETGYMPSDWSWMDGTRESVIAKIHLGVIVEVYSLEDEMWFDAGDLGYAFERKVIYASFEEALQEGE